MLITCSAHRYSASVTLSQVRLFRISLVIALCFVLLRGQTYDGEDHLKTCCSWQNCKTHCWMLQPCMVSTPPSPNSYCLFLCACS